MVFSKKKYYLLLSVLFIFLIILSGCSGGSSDPSNPDKELVDKSFSTQDFSYTYPAQWNTTTDDKALTDIRDLYQKTYGSNIYSSGSVTRGNNQQIFSIIAFDFSSYTTNNITQNDLILFTYLYQENFESNNNTAELIEQTNTNINGQPAIKILYEYNYNPRSKMNMTFTYKGLTFPIC